MPELPRRRASRLPALAARQGRRQLHQLPQHSRQQEKSTLLKAPQPTLCFQCHTDVKPQFNMPFHHPVNEGVVKCTDCHDVHGTFQTNNLRSTADQNMICTKCHMDMRGPFVYEHAPVKAEGCLACHSPHGSQNARMLNMPNINVLCNQCHSAVAAGTIHGQGAGIVGQRAVHELPHLHSWLEHQCGVSQIGSDGAVLRAIFGSARHGSHNSFARGFQRFDVGNEFYSSEASYEEHRLVFSAS